MRIAVTRAGRAAAVALLCATFVSPASAVTGDQIVATAQQYLGRPYRFGVDMSLCPRYFDCSAFTKYVYARHGVYLRRSSKEQSGQGVYVPRNALRPGDLVFFNSTSRPGIDHVGIYMGGNRFINTYGSPGVCIRYLTSSYWSRCYVTGRRIVSPGSGAAPASRPPVGFLDSVTTSYAAGWAADADTPGTTVTIHIYLDNPYNPAHMIGTTRANLYRPDVQRVTRLGSYHGFRFRIPPQYRGHVLYAYAINTGRGVNPLLTGSPKRIP